MDKFNLCAFSAVTFKDSVRFGWKAVCQALLANGGFCVPEGFLLRMEGIESTDKVYTRAKELFPGVLCGSAIMRSSAPNEDGNLSYAGVYDSKVFNGCSANEFALAVRAVKASYDRKEAELYARRNASMPEANKCLTALVQRMLMPSCSGVAYTLDPVTGIKHVIIESTHGINSLLTDGKISPDYVQVDGLGNVIARRLGKKQRMVGVSNGRLYERVATAEESRTFSISDMQIHELWNVARSIQTKLEKPQDIEWAFENGKLYILQSREISASGGCQ